MPWVTQIATEECAETPLEVRRKKWVPEGPSWPSLPTSDVPRLFEQEISRYRFGPKFPNELADEKKLISILRSAGIHVVRVKCDVDILTDVFKGFVEVQVRHTCERGEMKAKLEDLFGITTCVRSG
jgi:hypothetical protein